MSAPALEPVEQRILLDLEAVLAAISTTHVSVPFYTNVRRVYTMDKALGQTVETPCVLVAHTGTTHDYHAFAGGDGGLFESVINLELYPIVSRSGPNWRRDIVRFAADVRRAVMVDPHRGTDGSGNVNAFDSTVHQSDFANEVDGHNQAMARLTMQIQFRDYVNDPTLTA